jgi:hypothetical protein
MGFSETLTIVNYHFPDDTEDQLESPYGIPAIGTGYVTERGERFRVVDVWNVDEKNSGGLNPYGIHVFLEVANGADDRPGSMFPEWYRQD